MRQIKFEIYLRFSIFLIIFNNFPENGLKNPFPFSIFFIFRKIPKYSFTVLFHSFKSNALNQFQNFCQFSTHSKLIKPFELIIFERISIFTQKFRTFSSLCFNQNTFYLPFAVLQITFRIIHHRMWLRGCFLK